MSKVVWRFFQRKAGREDSEPKTARTNHRPGGICKEMGVLERGVERLDGDWFMELKRDSETHRATVRRHASAMGDQSLGSAS
jgi:hypothetical protein